MKKKGAVLLTLVAVIILILIFIDIENYGESYQNIPDEEIPLASIHPSPLFANLNDLAPSDNSTIQAPLNRTLILLAVLFVLWGLCIFLAARHNLFLSREDKSTNEPKGRRAKP
jgi:hypothetical protein